MVCAHVCSYSRSDAAGLQGPAPCRPAQPGPASLHAEQQRRHICTLTWYRSSGMRRAYCGARSSGGSATSATSCATMSISATQPCLRAVGAAGATHAVRGQFPNALHASHSSAAAERGQQAACRGSGLRAEPPSPLSSADSVHTAHSSGCAGCVSACGASDSASGRPRQQGAALVAACRRPCAPSARHQPGRQAVGNGVPAAGWARRLPT